MLRSPRPLGLLAATLVAACGPSTSDPQLPPTSGFVDMEAWLAQGLYKAWRCEAAPHPSLGPSPHGTVRICNNAKITAQPAGPGEYPVGAASVKELYASPDGGALAGYAVGVHLTAGTGPSSWYWYERNASLGGPAKNGSAGLLADGVGPGEGVAGTFTDHLCTDCHQQAGSDPAHRLSDSHDFVFTHVP